MPDSLRSPIRPRIAEIGGDRRNVKPTAVSQPFSRAAAAAAATIASASATLGAIGFSQRTCLPAASSPSTISRCRWLATTTLTTSTSSASASASQLDSARA
jgi:hypothetical protein